MYKKGRPKFSYSMFIFGQTKGGDIDATNPEDAKKQTEQMVLKIYKDIIDSLRKSIIKYEEILGMLS